MLFDVIPLKMQFAKGLSLILSLTVRQCSNGVVTVMLLEPEDVVNLDPAIAVSGALTENLAVPGLVENTAWYILNFTSSYCSEVHVKLFSDLNRDPMYGWSVIIESRSTIFSPILEVQRWTFLELVWTTKQ